MAQKHMSKKELKEDPFFEEVAHVIGFFQQHYKTLISIALIVAIGLSAFFISKNVTRRNTTEASGYFGIALDRYKKNQFREAEDQFLFVAEQYPKTGWGKRAHYYLGLVSRALGRPEEETLRYFENFLNTRLDDGALKASAAKLVATYYYRSGDNVNAGNYYLRAAQNTFSREEKMEYGIRAMEAFIEAGDEKNEDRVLNYLNGLELSEQEENRLTALSRL